MCGFKLRAAQISFAETNWCYLLWVSAKHLFVHESIRHHKLDFFAILETGRSDFSAPFLRHLSGGFDFSWYFLPPQGRSGGILVGINSSSLQVKKVSNGDYYVKFQIRNKRDGFEWLLIPVYGAAQASNKPEFLAEIVRTCENETLPLLIGGDFNIIRRQAEKNNDNSNPRWPFIFNAIIESLELREIAMSGHQFMWANRRTTQTFEKLDRVLASVEWEQKFPLVTVRALTRTGSDHTPLLIDSGEQAHHGSKTKFLFELSWLKQEGFFDMVSKEWASISLGANSMERWQNKICHIRSF
jgi:hypothetical protein